MKPMTMIILFHVKVLCVIQCRNHTEHRSRRWVQTADSANVRTDGTNTKQYPL